jgi:hypothetical protein
MARETSYFVQAFNAGRGGNLKADAPIACKTETGALRTAERLALSKVGVMALSSTGDPEMGDYDDEPTVIFRAGELVGLRLRLIARAAMLARGAATDGRGGSGVRNQDAPERTTPPDRIMPGGAVLNPDTAILR